MLQNTNQANSCYFFLYNTFSGHSGNSRKTSEGHMGRQRLLPLLDKEIKMYFCQRIVPFSLKGKVASFPCNIVIWIFFPPFSPRKELFIFWRQCEKYATWHVSVNWREESESHMSIFSLQSSLNVYLSGFKDRNNPKGKFIIERRFRGFLDLLS